MLNSTIYCMLSLFLINLQPMEKDIFVLSTILSSLLRTISDTKYALNVYLLNEGIGLSKVN